MPSRSVSDPPKAQTDQYSPHQKEAFLEAFNNAYLSPESLVRRYFSTFLSDDEEAMEAMMSDDFTFTSPRDDHIDRVEFFKRCWPHRHELRAIRIEEVFATGEEAFVRYEAEPKSGAPFRNVEFIRLDGPKVRAVEVYFGPSEKKY